MQRMNNYFKVSGLEPNNGKEMEQQMANDTETGGV